MEIRYNVTGTERKRLVQTIGRFLDVKPKYLGMPSMAYEIDLYTVDRDGTLSFSDRTDSAEVEGLLEAISAARFEFEPAEDDTAEEPTASAQARTGGLEIAVPRTLLTDAAIENLQKLVDSKAGLLRKALGADDLPIEVTDEKIAFPWFTETDAESVKAYTHLVTALCDMAKNAKRVTAKEKEVESEKYAFRCFLLRLGFIGAEYKTERKILLKNLSGSSAVRGGQKGDGDDAISE